MRIDCAVLLAIMLMSCSKETQESKEATVCYEKNVCSCISGSDLVLAGTISCDFSGYVMWSPGAGFATTEITINKVLHGPVPKSKALRVSIICDLMTEKDDWDPILQKGAKVIVFLKRIENGVPEWETAGMRWGLQPYSIVLENTIEKVKRQK